jgi:glycosyltransferase involved in cell wall biosynthesis
MPFWQAGDGSLWESEGSFARYVDSLAPYFDEVLLAVPAFDTPQAGGSRVRSSNIRLAPLPYFPGPRQFYPALPAIYARLREWVAECDVLNFRVPTPAGAFAYRLARQAGKPVFLLIVGDYQALLPHLPYRGIKRALFRAYVSFEERALSRMARTALAFANGSALRAKHEAQGVPVHETRTTTLSAEDIGTRADTCPGEPVRLLSVSRIDPRKGLRALPPAVSELAAQGHNVTLDIVGPTIGQIGDEERDAIRVEAQRLGVGERVTFRGAVPLDSLMRLYREYDIFVLPTGPGEGVPRVLLEAMANGLPIVTTDVAGIASLIRDGDNGLLVDRDSPAAIVHAVRRIISTPDLRRRLIASGYETARAHTLERQAAEMMRIVSAEFGIRPRTDLNRPVANAS